MDVPLIRAIPNLCPRLRPGLKSFTISITSSSLFGAISEKNVLNTCSSPNPSPCCYKKDDGLGLGVLAGISQPAYALGSPAARPLLSAEVARKGGDG